MSLEASKKERQKMSELAHNTSEILEDNTLLARAGEFSGMIIMRLLARIDSRHMDSIEDKPPTPSEALRALHAERDQFPPDALAVASRPQDRDVLNSEFSL